MLDHRAKCINIQCNVYCNLDHCTVQCILCAKCINIRRIVHFNAVCWGVAEGKWGSHTSSLPIVGSHISNFQPVHLHRDHFGDNTNYISFYPSWDLVYQTFQPTTRIICIVIILHFILPIVGSHISNFQPTTRRRIVTINLKLIIITNTVIMINWKWFPSFYHIILLDVM